MSLITLSPQSDCTSAYLHHLPASSHHTCLSVSFTYGTYFDGHDQVHHSEVEEHKKREHEVMRDVRDKSRHPVTGKVPPLKDYHEIDTIRHLDDGVYPPLRASVPPFAIDKTAVTNREYSEFVRNTKWVTGAEKTGWSYVLHFIKGENGGRLVDEFDGHWVAVEGAFWRNPEGIGSDVEDRWDHPVVHVNHKDAAKYCSWKGLRLPGDREFEAAARGGKWDGNYRFPWGDDGEGIERKMNLWQGEFPNNNTRIDGWVGTCPVREYEPNELGVYNLIGNVWEWCRGGKKNERPLRGGSYMDDAGGTVGGRGEQHVVSNAVRTHLGQEYHAGNIGFRCAGSVRRPHGHREEGEVRRPNRTMSLENEL